jgi:hypothetical protein
MERTAYVSVSSTQTLPALVVRKHSPDPHIVDADAFVEEADVRLRYRLFGLLDRRRDPAHTNCPIPITQPYSRGELQAQDDHLLTYFRPSSLARALSSDPDYQQELG